MHTFFQISSSYQSLIGGPILLGPYKVSDIAFVCIHKNAHTWASNLLKINFNFYAGTKHQIQRFDSTSNPKYMVIIRDPIERWISGCTQYLSKYDSLRAEKLLSNDVFQELLFDTLRFDNHTNLQVDYLQTIPIMKCVFFRQEDDLEATFTNFFLSKYKDKEILSVTDLSAYHYRSSNFYKNRLADKISWLIENNEKFKENLIKYTNPDRELIEFVSRNNLWYKSSIQNV